MRGKEGTGEGGMWNEEEGTVGHEGEGRNRFS